MYIWSKINKKCNTNLFEKKRSKIKLYSDYISVSPISVDESQPKNIAKKRLMLLKHPLNKLK